MKLVAATLLLLALTAVGNQSCATATGLSTIQVDQPPAAGTYHLLLHGCNYTNDPHTIAFFWPTEQPYTFKPYSPAFQFRLLEGLPMADALAQAHDFVNCSPHFDTARLRAVTKQPDGIIGYELRPLYVQPSPLLRRDVLQVYYRLLGAQEVRINIIPFTPLDDDRNDID
ncbi:hypothetical protein [Desulfurivibrio alkaliphilus]|uniref:Lipoprotein n=1 Tax=Desulfurivibrio alkaliphilus (strain DSM 19089 / UNIQEM U267 / AHT2) TaxID=589865 RepID=D6Z6I3_DESAT|nr:hypothetical protein [Desulfurivibrio alkaliphilus]ADH84942.1 hypothetical protein DaAHT2_0231 [Desulfurivibrio alkaliphilus AHT 2]